MGVSTSRHVVLRGAEAVYGPSPIFEGRASGHSAWVCVDHTVPGAVHTAFTVHRLEDGGRIDRHVQSYEESIFVLDGEVVVDTPEGAYTLVPGDYAFVPIGLPHSLRNTSGAPARWAEMLTPQPRPDHGWDTYFVPAVPDQDPRPVDVRDPRTRSLGHISPENMDVDQQTQDRLAVSASMRTALLVYSGITVKMMVDTDLGSQLHTMFMVQYVPGGFAGKHDHPLEEAYLFVAGAADATFDDDEYLLETGDFAFAGVGCVHSFRNHNDDALVRWLETQAPGPPARHTYRFARDWEYLRDRLG